MASNVVFNGVTYSIPAVGDSGWGADLSAYFISIASNALQKTGGNFTLTSEVNFGATYGVRAPYFRSTSTNPAVTGNIRLANTDPIAWRNAANSADLSLYADASGALVFNGTSLTVGGDPVQTEITVSDTSTIDMTLSVGNDLSASVVSDSITNAMINSAAAIAYSKLNLSNSIVNADVNASAAIAYSKLNLSASLVNADISTSAAIALSKLASLTTSRALQSNASTGAIEVSSVTNTELSYLSGVTSAVQTQLNAKISNALTTTTGDIIYASSANTPARLAIGSTDQVLTVSGGIPAWSTASSSPISSLEISNLGLAVSVASNAMTIELKQADGSTNPAAGASSVKAGFRSSTISSGAFNQRAATGAVSLVVSSGSTLGMTSAKAATLFVYLIDNAGTLELAVSQTAYAETGFITTTSEGGAGAADSGLVVYSTTSRANVPFRMIATMLISQATAGSWVSLPTRITVGDYAKLLGEPISLSYGSIAGGSIGTSNTLQTFGSVEFDSLGWWSGTTFTPQMSGLYSIESAILSAGVTLSTSQAITLVLYKNGSSYRTIDLSRGNGATTIAYFVKGGDKIHLLAGQTAEIYAASSVATTQNTAGGYNKISITRVGN